MPIPQVFYSNAEILYKGHTESIFDGNKVIIIMCEVMVIIIIIINYAWNVMLFSILAIVYINKGRTATNIKRKVYNIIPTAIHGKTYTPPLYNKTSIM